MFYTVEFEVCCRSQERYNFEKVGKSASSPPRSAVGHGVEELSEFLPSQISVMEKSQRHCVAQSYVY